MRAPTGPPTDEGLAAGTVKIDGLREPSQAVAAVEAGADLIGFIFAPARRRVTPEVARSCIEAARRVANGRAIRAVGVFVDADAAEINSVAEAASLDLVQLHGEEPPSLLADLRRPAIKVMRPRAGSVAAEVARAMESFRRSSVAPVAFLIDGYTASAAGGEGIPSDWGLAAALARDFPLLLAGGLSADNVGEAIRSVTPLGVDVSSGVETDGIKDRAKMRAFVLAAKRQFREGMGDIDKD